MYRYLYILGDIQEICIKEGANCFVVRNLIYNLIEFIFLFRLKCFNVLNLVNIFKIFFRILGMLYFFFELSLVIFEVFQVFQDFKGV